MEKIKIAYLMMPSSYNKCRYSLKDFLEKIPQEVFKLLGVKTEDIDLFLVQSLEEDLNQYDYIIFNDTKFFPYLKEFKSLDRLYYIEPFNNIETNPFFWEEGVRLIFKEIINHMNQDKTVYREYPKTYEEIKDYLNKLKKETFIACDIETTSLKVSEAGIYSIGFATSPYNSGSFLVKDEPRIRELLKDFFLSYEGYLIFHKANYDVPVLIYELFMDKDFTNLLGQKEGLDAFFKGIHDTLLMSYLVSNNVAGNTLGLKDWAKPFMGDWAVNVKDITKLDEKDLLQYNADDCRATYYLFKYLDRFIEIEKQKKLYITKFIPYLKDCIRMQLNGFTLDKDKVARLDNDLNQEKEELISELMELNPIKLTEMIMAIRLRDEKNAKLKTKKLEIKDTYKYFNFNSNKWLQTLLYEVMKLPVIEKTLSNAPSTSGSTLMKLYNLSTNEEYRKILKNIADYKDCEKIISAFLPAFKNPCVDSKGTERLVGSFNLGGTISGRMSSSQPNIQQIPSTGSRFAKIVKECFIAPKGYVLVGIDFSSLEARLDALLTKDKNKLKVYEEGFDAHCLNAYIAFNNQMENIDFNDVNSINSIKDKYPELRQKAKTVGFALQYGGSPKTLVKNSGLNPQLAEEVYKNYHEAYKTSNNWKARHLSYCNDTGFVEGAFGLKIRANKLTRKADRYLPVITDKQKRTIGNALVQGWGMLNNRALNEILETVDNLGLTEYIYPVASIHDANYFVVKNNVALLHWFNEIVVEAISWQEDDRLIHPQVRLTGNLEIYFPSWSKGITIPNSITEPELEKLLLDNGVIK